MTKMDFMTPFIHGVQDLFATMLQDHAQCERVSTAVRSFGTGEVMGMVGLSGTLRGVVALLIPVPTALAMVERLVGHPVDRLDGALSDGIAELVNMIAGAGKARLSDANRPPIDLGLPTVFHGHDFCVLYPTYAVWAEAEFSSGFGAFRMQVTLDSDTLGQPR